MEDSLQRHLTKGTVSPPAVIGGAVAGKTGALTARIVHLVERGVDPARILAITFTSKTALQIKTRVKAALDRVH